MSVYHSGTQLKKTVHFLIVTLMVECAHHQRKCYCVSICTDEAASIFGPAIGFCTSASHCEDEDERWPGKASLAPWKNWHMWLIQEHSQLNRSWKGPDFAGAGGNNWIETESRTKSRALLIYLWTVFGRLLPRSSPIQSAHFPHKVFVRLALRAGPRHRNKQRGIESQFRAVRVRVLPDCVLIHDMKGQWMEPHGEMQSVLFTPERIKVLPNCGSPEKAGLKKEKDVVGESSHFDGRLTFDVKVEKKLLIQASDNISKVAKKSQSHYIFQNFMSFF